MPDKDFGRARLIGSPISVGHGFTPCPTLRLIDYNFPNILAKVLTIRHQSAKIDNARCVAVSASSCPLSTILASTKPVLFAAVLRENSAEEGVGI